MSNSAEQELLALTKRLLQGIAAGDWDSYKELCDETLTAFEPEAKGQLVEGLEFHRYYFDLGGHQPGNVTMAAPRVRMLGKDAAVVTYVRLVQSTDDDGRPRTAAFEETRVWRRSDGRWKHVHFHRSVPTP